jgi:hypothetical protein
VSRTRAQRLASVAVSDAGTCCVTTAVRAQIDRTGRFNGNACGLLGCVRLPAFVVAFMSTVIVTACSVVPNVHTAMGLQHVTTYSPAQLATWTQASRYGGASCSAANGATVHATSTVLQLTTTGQAGSCAVVASPFTVPTNSGTVEVRAFLPPNPSWAQFADWPAIWLRGANWPVNGELDALEGLTGYDYATYWYQGASGPEKASTCTDQCGESIDVFPVSAPAVPGWVTIDVAFSPHSATVSYNGRLFATFSGSYVTGQPMQIVADLTSGPDGGAAVPATMQVAYIRLVS